MTVFHHDFETRSVLDLRKVGSSRYARHPTTEPIVLGYAFDDGPVEQWQPDTGAPLPGDVRDALLDPQVVKAAWNKPFEAAIWRHCFGVEIPHDQWRDPMVMALFCSLPASLLACGRVMNLPAEHLKTDGARLLNWFSKPRTPRGGKPAFVFPHEQPERWQELLDYNRSDVLSERRIFQLLKPFDLPPEEWELWRLDQEINERGIPVNLAMCRNVIDLRDELNAKMMEELGRLTGLDNPNSQQQLLGWLRDHDYPYLDLQKGHVAAALADTTNALLARVLQLRQLLSRTSTKKFDALMSHTDEDGRLRNTMQFSGAARTTRWSGRVFQPQNLLRALPGLDGLNWGTTPLGHRFVTGGTQVEVAEILERLTVSEVETALDRPIEAMAGAVRTVVQAPDGYVFADADFTAVENVCLGWEADDRNILEPFLSGRDPYLDFGRYLYQMSYADLEAEYKAGDKTKRQICKPAVLGCGYGLGAGKQWRDDRTGELVATGLLAYARAMGVELSEAQSETSVVVWREAYRGVVQYWYDLERAMRTTIQTGRTSECRHIRFDRRAPFVRMHLPGGSTLHYLRPRIEEVMAPWGEPKMSVTYEGYDRRHQWGRLSTHPGKVVENATQKLARDLLGAAMLKAASRGLDIVMHVHDQIIALVPEDQADAGLSTLLECMNEVPAWAEGLPLRAAGHLSNWFVKD